MRKAASILRAITPSLRRPLVNGCQLHAGLRSAAFGRESFHFHPTTIRNRAQFLSSAVSKESVQSEADHEAEIIQENDSEPKKEPSKVSMPDFDTDQGEGTLVKWMKAEGDLVAEGDALCEVELQNFIVGVDADHAGLLAKIKVPEGEDSVRHGQILCLLVQSEEELVEFQRAEAEKAAMQQAAEAEKAAAVEQGQEAVQAEGVAAEEGGALCVNVQIVRDINHLMKSGKITDQDLAMQLLSLARNSDQALQIAYEGSKFDGKLDEEFFLVQASAMVEEQNLANKEQPVPAPKDL